MRRLHPILLSVLLALPVVLFLLHQYFYHNANLICTGFTNDENVLYMSYAHQYLDNEHFSLFYSNPFDGNPNSAKIYFQPINFIFALAMKLGFSPGWVLSLFGLLFAILCIYVGKRLIQLVVKDSNQRNLILLLFTWGGGLTGIAGLIGSSILPGHQYFSWLDGIFLGDPANGWWGLNWGRTLFIPLEAYYHFLFLINIYLILKQKWKTSLLISLLLSISHPFTGTEYLTIINGWVLVEKIFFRNKKIPVPYWVGLICVSTLHGWYYLVYLNSFPEHQQIFSQYSASWTYSLPIALIGYCLVIGLALLALLVIKPAKKNISTSSQRLFLCWAIISFLLSKHEWFIEPLQPIHFTRGYIWAGLFLFSIPGLAWLIGYLDRYKIKKWILSSLVIIFLSDNILWTVNLLRKKEKFEWEGHITTATKNVFEFLHSTAYPNDLLVGNARLVNYMSNVYTHTNSWVSHPYNTPNKQIREDIMKDYFKTGKKPDIWKNRRLFIVLDKTKPIEIDTSLSKKKIFENERYIIYSP